MVRYLDVTSVAAVNKLVTQEHFGVRDATLLRSAVGEPSQGAFGADLYPEVQDKAAALFRGIARNHAFVDGNKRTALISTDVFLRSNGMGLKIDSEELVTTTLAVACGVLEVPDLAERLNGWMLPVYQLNRCAVSRAADVLSVL